MNPAYKTAREQLVVFHPDVMTIRIPKPDQVPVLAKAWVADLCWRNIPDKQLNPKGHIGFFRALLGYAAQPIRPYLGWVITEPV